ncbi:TonB family protein [Alloacidobacterium dinghuense]|uniref:TonB family protein n=1 Tax=Alloacidobacterium dinghuense TaxID=2763107 RepID=A0A7G8BFR0_9BACT|nr:cell envelope integrity protein TolA [Alloacidobacterium dinghuense]QNI31380.1 TonB family protein [Alloacidobacterium dinghuense]
MPITEVPTDPAGAPPEPPRKSRRSRYENLEHHELLQVMDDLQDERGRARLREFFWISIIVHMIIFWFLLYGPKYVWHRNIRVVDPSEILKQREKELTYLDLPDALKKIKPKQSDVISDQNRTAESKKPTLDKKTLQQLQAMRRAGPPAPSPVPAPQMGQTPQPAPQQQAQSTPPPPQPMPQQRPSQPLQNDDQAKLEAPKPATRPDFSTATTAGQAIQQAARNAMRPGQTGGGGDMGANAPSQHPGDSGAVDILSDTMGVDFGPYIRRIIYDTERSWWPIIPESAQPPLLKQGKVGIRFRILPDGSVKQMILEFPSGDVALDHAAWGGITGASPYPPLPKEFKGPFLELRFYFLYNIRPDE